MASFFEPDSFLLDPTSCEDPASAFLSFSSFASLANTAAHPFDFASWDHGLEAHLKGKTLPTQPIIPSSQPSSDSAFSDTSSPRDPLGIGESAFEANGPVGIFIGPTPVRKPAPSAPPTTASYRSSSSSNDGWDEPITPGLTTRSSIESFASVSTVHPGAYKQTSQPYSWDDASTGMGTASSYTHVPHRSVSNPTLNRNQPRVPRPMASMPSLKEEDTINPSAWFDGTEQIDPALLTSTGSAPTAQPNDGASSLQVTTDLADDFEWVFGEYGLGAVEAPQSSLYTPFSTEEPTSAGPSSSATSNRDLINSLVCQQQTANDSQSWQPNPSAQDAVGTQSYDYSAITNLPNFTVDPMAILGPPFGTEDEISRPSSAPGFNTGEGSNQLLSVPLADSMTRSVSSDGLTHSRQAPPRELFSYTPQAIPSGPPAPQPLYTTAPSASFTHAPRNLSLSQLQTRRASAHGLSVQIQPMAYSSFNPSASGSQSATFGDFSSQQSQPMAVQMTRAGTQPLPTIRRLSTSESLPMVESKIPVQIARAQAIYEMQEARQEAQRQEMRRISATRQVGVGHDGSPVYQQPGYGQALPLQQYQVHPPPQRQSILGWEGPSAQTASLPVLTTTPLVNIHPPSAPYIIHQGVAGGSPMKIHPPPHPGMTTRPLANLPVTPPRQRKTSASPNKRTPKKRQGQGGGGFSWGETTFINFTSDDAEKLLTGVAPSGSQGKRKREEGAYAGSGEDGVAMSRERSKRSRSDE